MSRIALLLVTTSIGFTACGGSAETAEPVDTFGHRWDNRDDEGRETLLLAPVDSTMEFFTYPAVVMEVEHRAGGVGPGGRRPVELLLKGALPDACTTLHNVAQRQYGNTIEVTFDMRRPKGAVCARVVRPYRFYYVLENPLAPGPYTLKLNDAVHPFEVFPERTAEG